MNSETALEPPINSGVWHRLFFYKWYKSLSGWTVAVFSLLTVLFILYQIFQWGDEKQVAFLADIAQAVFSIGVVVFSWRVVRHPSIDSDSKRAWRSAAIAFTAYSFGHVIWFYYSSILQIEPFPSLADVGFWLFYPLMMWALLSFPTAKTSQSEKIKFLLDVGIVLLGGTTAVWDFIIRPTIEKSGDNDLTMTLLNLSYVVGDLVLLLGVATILLRLPSKVNKIALFIIVAGLHCNAISDIGFAYFTLQGTYTAGHWIDNFFIIGLLVFLFAVHFQYQNLSLTEQVNEEPEEQLVSHKFSWLPYLAIGVVFGVLVYETREFLAQSLGVIVFASLIVTGLVVLRQITAIKENVRYHADQAKRQSEVHFRLLVQNSSDLITILNTEGKILYESPSIKNVLGFEVEELTGSQSFELIHPDDVEKRKDIFERLKNEPESIISEELRFKHKDGKWHVLETVSRVFNEENNNLSGILVNSRDITERKLDEEKLKIYMAKLEQSNRELQDFAYVASHDLQEPLRKVQAFGDRLHRKCGERLSEEGQDYIRRMREAAGRMQTLISDLLTFSRVTTKAQPFRHVDVKKITDEVVSDLEVRIEQTKGKVEVGDLPTIDADPVQIRQLMQNLIGNALKFHRPDETPVIKVYAEDDTLTTESFVLDGEEIQTVGSGNQQCKIVIQDNGIGFDEKYLDKIFTVFQRLHGRTEYEGSGIGLAVCRKIVERHGGNITAKSKPSEGAKFFITLPILQEKGDISIYETRS